MIRRSFGLLALLPLVAAPTCAQRFDPPAGTSGAASDPAPEATGPGALHRVGNHENAVQTDAVRWHPSFNAALAAAKISGKKVLVDIYAPWCPWCRRMQAEVYPAPSVRSEVARYYEAVRLDGEDTTKSIRFTPAGQTQEYHLSPQQLAVALGAEGYPTIAFMTKDGGYVTRVPGFADAVTFRRALRYVGTDAYRTQAFDAFEPPPPGTPAPEPQQESPR
ncbi:MAG: thioredoxin family protein [Rhodothermales bacterium]|nr:thioredoxin family protein [Rhodothermales bacterium]